MFKSKYIHLSCVLSLLESVIWEKESELSACVLKQLLEDTSIEPKPDETKVDVLLSLFCLSLPIFGRSQTGNLSLFTILMWVAFSRYRPLIDSKRVRYYWWKDGMCYCRCRIARAVTDFLAKLQDLPLSKQDSIMLILGNDWIFKGCRFFENSSLIDPSETNPCIHTARNSGIVHV